MSSLGVAICFRLKQQAIHSQLQTDQGVMKRPSLNPKRQRHLVESAMAAAVRAIPKGQTWSKMEVFRKALQKLGRGDEGIDTGVRTRLGGELTRVVAQRARGWHRVVASDGSFLGASDKEQLAALQREGARPRTGETVTSWAKRCKCLYVATYKASLQRACLAATDPGVNKWPAWSVEPIRSKAALKERLSLSGGKLFHHPQEQRPAAPAFASKRACSKPPKTIKQALKMVQPRLRKLLTAGRLEELQKGGATRLRRVLQPKECAQLLKEAAEVAPFDEVRRLDGEAGQGGAYHFCSGSASPLVEAIRSTIYDHLVKAWPELCSYGKSLVDFEQRCCAAGQKRCATIFLAFGEGGQNLAHQDPYGRLFFPYQAMLMLSRRGTDFTGGEFFVKNMKTGEVCEVPADEGDVTIFAANSAAVKGQDFKHGVRTVNGQRFSVGIVFNRRT